MPDEKNYVTVSSRISRDLFEQAKAYGTQYRINISELLREGLELRLAVKETQQAAALAEDADAMARLRAHITEDILARLYPTPAPLTQEQPASRKTSKTHKTSAAAPAERPLTTYEQGLLARLRPHASTVLSMTIRPAANYARDHADVRTKSGKALGTPNFQRLLKALEAEQAE